MKSRIGHVILSVSDWDKSKAFYDTLMEALGFTGHLYNEEKGFGLKDYRSEGHNLMIQYEEGQKHAAFNRFPGLNHVAFWVENIENVDKVYDVIKRAGTVITREPKKYPEYGDEYYAFFFRDPDGIPLEVATW